MDSEVKRVFVLFDTPPHLNDKSWLTQELCNLGFEVREVVLHSNKTLTRMYIEGGIQRLLCRFLFLTQAIRAIYLSRKGDSIICWNSTSGNLVNALILLLRLNRQLICMNWLTPQEVDVKSVFRKLCVSNRNVSILVNHKAAATQYRTLFSNEGVIVRASFYWFPDIYDDKVVFLKPNKTLNTMNRLQCFTGGLNNRDWGMIVTIAHALPEVDFVCVCIHQDWESKVVGIIPDNIHLYESLPLSEYQNLMRRSTVVLLPLLEDRASGIINIIRAAQDGHLCCVTHYSFTEQYFPNPSSPFLLENSSESWEAAIQHIARMTPEEYSHEVAQIQEYIKATYSPNAGAERLSSIIRNEGAITI